MTEATKVLGIRLENKDKEELQKYLNRESAEALLRQIKRGEITLTRKGVVIERVNMDFEGVNNLKCETCPLVNNLNMEAFDEVCEFKGLDRQEALNKCVMMLWR